MEVTKEELQDMISAAVTNALAVGTVKVAALPVMYKFPEDIVKILGDHVPENTIRSWRTAGYLRITYVGIRPFVTQEQWQWFLDNHKELMALNSTHPHRKAVANA